MVRDASYTTQPLELLNTIGFGNTRNQTIVTGDLDVNMGDTPKFTNAEQSENPQSIDIGAVDSARNQYLSSVSDQEMGLRTDADSEG